MYSKLPHDRDLQWSGEKSEKRAKGRKQVKSTNMKSQIKEKTY